MQRMVAVFSVVVLLAVVFCGQAAAYNVTVSSELAGGNAYIPKGTLIEAELVTGVNTGDNGVNDIAYFKLKQNVVVDGVVVLPSGTVGNAYVTKAKPAGFLGRAGEIKLTVRSVQALNGAVVPITAEVRKYGETVDKYLPYLVFGLYDMGKIKLPLYADAILRGEQDGLSLLSLYHTGFTNLVLFTEGFKGEEREIPAGTKFVVAVDEDADLGCTPDRLPVVMIKLR